MSYTNQEFAIVENNDTMSDNTIDNLLLRMGFRRNCPVPQQLGDYQLELLEADAAARVRAHVERCADCQQDLAQLRTFMTPPEPIWVQIHDWAMQVWRDTEHGMRVLLRPLQTNALSAPTLATRGRTPATAQAQPLKHVHIDVGELSNPDDLSHMDIEVVINRSATAVDECNLEVRIEIPSRWPEMAGIQVRASADRWETQGHTDPNGTVYLAGLPLQALDNLLIELVP